MIRDRPVTESIPESVRHLDALLNRRVRQARNDDELNTALRTAVQVKKQISSVVPSAVDAEARAVLVRLKNEVKE